MDNKIANNLHNLLKDYQENNKDFDEDKLAELGEKAAKEITQLPTKEQTLAWNVVVDAFSEYINYELVPNMDIVTAIAAGASEVVSSREERMALADGITKFNTFRDSINKPQEDKIDVYGTIHGLMRKHHAETEKIKSDPSYSSDSESEKERRFNLGVNVAKAFSQLPVREHEFAWTIACDAFFFSPTKDNHEVLKQLADVVEGSKSVITEPGQRAALENGFAPVFVRAEGPKHPKNFPRPKF